MVQLIRRGPRGMSLTMTLLLLNVAAFIVVFVALLFLRSSEATTTFLSYIALNPSLVLEGRVWTLLTSMFVHIEPSHLLVNMISLFFIGTFVEQLIGRKRFLWFYLLSGLIAGMFFVLFAYLGAYVPRGEAIFGGIDSYAVGASGALFGLGGLLAVLLPRLRVLVFFVIPMRMWMAMAVLMFGLWAFSAVAELNVGNSAHFGGLLVGLLYGFYLRKKYPKKVHMLNRMFK